MNYGSFLDFSFSLSYYLAKMDFVRSLRTSSYEGLERENSHFHFLGWDTFEPILDIPPAETEGREAVTTQPTASSTHLPG